VLQKIPKIFKKNVVCVCAQKKNAIFFFGSQTGTAEDYANRLAREARQFGFQPIVADMEQYDLVWSACPVCRTKSCARACV